MKEKVAEYILGTNGTVVKIVGTTSMTLLLVPTLELDVANVAICFRQTSTKDCSDVICFGHNEALGAATITLPGLD